MPAAPVDTPATRFLVKPSYKLQYENHEKAASNVYSNTSFYAITNGAIKGAFTDALLK